MDDDATKQAERWIENKHFQSLLQQIRCDVAVGKTYEVDQEDINKALSIFIGELSRKFMDIV